MFKFPSGRVPAKSLQAQSQEIVSSIRGMVEQLGTVNDEIDVSVSQKHESVTAIQREAAERVARLTAESQELLTAKGQNVRIAARLQDLLA